MFQKKKSPFSEFGERSLPQARQQACEQFER
jgi:hypothetical protein